MHDFTREKKTIMPLLLFYNTSFSVNINSSLLLFQYLDPAFPTKFSLLLSKLMIEQSGSTQIH